MIFSQDHKHRLIQNLSIHSKALITPGYEMSQKEKNSFYQDIEQASQMIMMYDRYFDDQFHNTCRVRRVCLNPECKTAYAYFYEDFLFCPKCGTELITTRDDREEMKGEKQK